MSKAPRAFLHTTLSLLALLVWFFVALTMPSQVAADSTFRSADNHYSLTLPDGWVEIPEETIRLMVTFLFYPNHESVIVDAGFQHEDRDSSAYPYVLVRWFPYGIQPSEDEMSAFVSSSFATVNKGQKFSDLAFDAANRTFTATFEHDVAVVGKVKGAFTGYFGRSGLALLLCYSLATDFNTWEDDLTTIQTSFRFDPSADYTVIAAGGFKWSIFFKDVGFKVLIGTMLGALSVVIVAAVKRMRKRGNQTQE